jgi:hypothetical protein
MTTFPETVISRRKPLSRLSNVGYYGMAILLLLVVVACSSPDLNGPTSQDPAQLPWSLSLNTRAILMSTVAPYDTLQLSAVVRNPAGTPLTDVPVVTYVSLDSSVRVNATGLLTARHMASRVKVVASTVTQGILLVDTATINVDTAATPPPFDSLQLGLQPGDSARLSYGFSLSGVIYEAQQKKILRIGAFGDGGQIPKSLVSLTLSDQQQFTLSSSDELVNNDSKAIVTGSATASAALANFTLWRSTTIFATATIFGVTRKTSLTLTATPEVFFSYKVLKSKPLGSTTSTFTLYPDHSEVIGVGGCVWWEMTGATKADTITDSDSLDIVFDDSTAASPDGHGEGLFGSDVFNTGGGSIAPFTTSGDFLSTFDPTNVRSRCFLRAGTFLFHSTKLPLSGAIVVEAAPPLL